MKSKLHFGILIVLLTLIVRFLETPAVPNQQIVIQFSDTEISDNVAEQTIEAIRTKLHIIGVEQIKVGQDGEGRLKITYFSTTEVEDIQNILSGHEDLLLTYGIEGESSHQDPIKQSTETYKLDVSEIQDSKNSTDWDFDGVQVVEHNQKSDRFTNPKKSNSGHHNHSIQISEGLKVTFNAIHKDLIKTHCLYSFPEVRAGPIA